MKQPKISVTSVPKLLSHLCSYFRQWKVQESPDDAPGSASECHEEHLSTENETPTFTAREQEGTPILQELPPVPTTAAMCAHNVIPSKGRDPESILFMAATGTQPAGKALPSLFPSPIVTMGDHVAFATTLDPHSILLREAIPKFAWDIAKDIRTDPIGVVGRRTKALNYIRKLSATLGPANERWVAHLPTQSPSKRINFALIHFLTSNLRYPDAKLAVDLSWGMPLMGNVPATGVFPKRVREQAMPTDVWKDGLAQRNRDMIQRVTALADAELPRLCWEKTIEEVKKGWLTQPIPVTDAAIQSIPLSPRFAIWENRNEKIRIIDDFKASKVNDLLGLVDTSIPQNLDVLLGMALVHADHWGEETLRVFSLDFAHAYKHVGVAVDQLDFATVVLADTEGNPMMATLRTQPFGSRRAPANWARVTTFLQFVLRKVFGVWLGIFVDDCYCVEPQGTITSSLWVVRELCAILGLELAHAKEKAPCTTIDILGAAIKLTHEDVTAQLTDQRRSDYLTLLRNVLRKNNLSPAAAAKIRGKLGFAQSMLFGKYGRAMLHEFTMRQYSPARGTAFPLSPLLVETIQWWIDTLPLVRPRSIRLRPLTPVTVYTDAEGSGHIAAVLFAQSTKAQVLCHTHCPEWMLEEETKAGIFEFELLAVALAVCYAVMFHPRRPILICCDNQGANGAVIRGSCKTAIGRLISAFIWRLAAESDNPIWIEYVSSGLNVADAPSRDCSDGSPVNEFTKGMENSPVPQRFSRALSSMENLKNMGIGSIPAQTQWKCPVQ